MSSKLPNTWNLTPCGQNPLNVIFLSPQGADPSIENVRGHTALLGSWDGLKKRWATGHLPDCLPHGSSRLQLRWDLANGEATKAVTGQRNARAADAKVLQSYGDRASTLPNSE